MIDSELKECHQRLNRPTPIRSQATFENDDFVGKTGKNNPLATSFHSKYYHIYSFASTTTVTRKKCIVSTSFRWISLVFFLLNFLTIHSLAVAALSVDQITIEGERDGEADRTNRQNRNDRNDVDDVIGFPRKMKQTTSSQVWHFDHFEQKNVSMSHEIRLVCHGETDGAVLVSHEFVDAK